MDREQFSANFAISVVLKS